MLGIRTGAPAISPTSESYSSGVKIASMGSQPPIVGEGLYIEEQEWNVTKRSVTGDHPAYPKCIMYGA
jgi:hypothetical protein